MIPRVAGFSDKIMCKIKEIDLPLWIFEDVRNIISEVEAASSRSINRSVRGSE